LIHLLILENKEGAAKFLVTQEPDVNIANRVGETPLHLAALKGFEGLTKALLESGSNPNLQTVFKSEAHKNLYNGDENYRQTPLHLAIKTRQKNVIHALVSGKDDRNEDDTVNNKRIEPNFNIKNSSGLTPLALALSEDLHEIATDLLKGGASVNVTDANGFTLLHSALMDGNCDAALFLLNNGADVNIRTKNNETCIELAIKKNLIAAVESLCRMGADLFCASGSDPPLWLALDQNQDLASILVRYGADTDSWSEGPDGCHQTLLHRCIDENQEDKAAFLIRCGCDLNSPRKVGPDGRGGDEAYDLASPLHLCSQWGLEEVVRTLLEHGANKNAKVCITKQT
jgi:ankyrin repeat protein